MVSGPGLERRSPSVRERDVSSCPVRAEDRDSGSTSEVRYALVEEHLEEEPLFTLNPFSGWLTLNRELGEAGGA